MRTFRPAVSDGVRRRVALGAGVALLASTTAILALPASAAAKATLKVTPSTGGPGAYVNFSGANWAPSDGVVVTILGVGVCTLTPNTAGTIPNTTCPLPSVASGAAQVSAEQDSNAKIATATVTIVPRVTYLQSASVGPGASIIENAGGFKAANRIKVYLDSTSSTPLATSPATPATDSTGSINDLTITTPTTTAAGVHTLILSDAAGQTVSKSLTFYKPTFTLAPTTGGPGSFNTITGAGWAPGGTVGLSINGANFCNPVAKSNGSINTVCTVPSTTAGAHPLLAAENNSLITVAKTFTITSRIVEFPSPWVSPGAAIRADTQGLAPSSAVTATLAGTSAHLTISPAGLTTDTTGYTGALTVTIPAGAGVGAHVLTIADAAGHKATSTVYVYKPTATVSATTGSPGQYLLFSGSGFQPNSAVTIGLGTGGVTTTTANAAGSFSTYASLPDVPAGAQTLTFQQDGAAIAISKAFTVTPTVYYLPEYAVSGGASIRVDTYGLGASSAVIAKLAGTTAALATNPTNPTTDGNGSIVDLLVTIPTAATVGSHVLTIATGSHSATGTIDVFKPTVTLGDASGPANSSFSVTGSGLWSGDSVTIYFGTEGVCSTSVDGSGAANGACSVPGLAAGSYAVTAQQDSGAISVKLGNFVIN